MIVRLSKKHLVGTFMENISIGSLGSSTVMRPGFPFPQRNIGWKLTYFFNFRLLVNTLSHGLYISEKLFAFSDLMMV